VAIEAELPPGDPLERACARLQRSRLEIVQLMVALRGDERRADEGFPRSRLMRLAMGRGGRTLAGGAALSIALLRPGLIPLVARWIPWTPLVPLLRIALNRYAVRRKKA
jgi:hypothetical protein